MDSIDFPSSLLSLNAPIRGFLINTPITILRNMKAKPFPTLFEKQRVLLEYEGIPADVGNLESLGYDL